MRRAIARGRVFPQSYSTDRRFSRLSIMAIALYPLMWANADDQGRLGGDPDEIKYTCCPNIDHITKSDIPALLTELSENHLIVSYKTSKTEAIQMLDWWEVQRLQWAWPSEYPAADGWKDHLRYKKNAKEVLTLNWPVSPEDSPERSPENSAFSPLTTPIEKEEEEERGRGRRKSPEASGEKPAPSPSDFCTDRNKISAQILEQFRYCFGHVKAKEPRKNIPREPAAKELAQMRDLTEELLAGGGVPLDFVKQAFREAGSQEEKSKKSISYVAAILREWLDRPRERSP